MPFISSVGMVPWAEQAFETAGLVSGDIHVAGVDELITGIGRMSYEDVTFAERFGDHKLVEAVVMTNGGELPVNASGEARGIHTARPESRTTPVCLRTFAAKP